MSSAYNKWDGKGKPRTDTNAKNPPSLKDDFKGISSSKEEGKQTTLSRGVGARGDRSSSGDTQQATICATPNYSSETSASFPSYPSFPSVAVSRILFIVIYCVGKSLLLSFLRAKYP
ncbi:unnamed protein product [Vicia faba]|uniref:Uncharacterized protein n=1 Tax=Vicia faba TaxID=3906 RepID=A0AAV0YQ98_VICFA|nr:unnamed protein product [Vicia faba]